MNKEAYTYRYETVYGYLWCEFDMVMLFNIDDWMGYGYEIDATDEIYIWYWNYMNHAIKEDLWQSCTGFENIEGPSGQI